jgi:hypothetical protein
MWNRNDRFKALMDGDLPDRCLVRKDLNRALPGHDLG